MWPQYIDNSNIDIKGILRPLEGKIISYPLVATFLFFYMGAHSKAGAWEKGEGHGTFK